MSSLSIGIDLGSYWTRVGIIEESGQFRMIYQMHSIFAFDQDQSEVPTFGVEALKTECYKVVADANRDQRFAAKHGQVTSTAIVPADEIVPFQCYAKYVCQKEGSYHLPRTVNNNASMSPGIGAKATTFALRQQAIIASILAHLKAEVLKKMGDCRECHAIIAVPSFSGDNHRRVILEAAKLAGCFQSVQLLNQTTAALIAYNFDRQQVQRGKKQAIVEDQQLFGLISFGASSFECSLFHPFDANNSSSSCSLPKLVATAGTTEFGSSTFTDQLAQWCLALIDPDGNKLGMNVWQRIWEKCEQAKQLLSFHEKKCATIDLHYHDNEKGQKTIDVDIQRADFEQMCQPLLDKLGQIIERTFGPNRGRIGRILLAGEGCEMPALMQMVEPFLAENCMKVETIFNRAPGNWAVKGVAIKARAVEKRRREGNTSEPPFEDLLYRRVDLAFPTAGISLNLFKPEMQIPTDESERFELEQVPETVELLLEEDGNQMAKFAVRDKSDSSKQIAFRIGLNGLLQARLYNRQGQHRNLEFLANPIWPNLYGMDGLDMLREELTKLSILPRANADSKENEQPHAMGTEVDENMGWVIPAELEDDMANFSRLLLTMRL